MSSALLASRRACRAENPKVVATVLKSEPASAISASTIAVFISPPVGTVQGERPRLAAGGRHRRPPGRYPPERRRCAHPRPRTCRPRSGETAGRRGRQTATRANPVPWLPRRRPARPPYGFVDGLHLGGSQGQRRRERQC